VKRPKEQGTTGGRAKELRWVVLSAVDCSCSPQPSKAIIGGRHCVSTLRCTISASIALGKMQASIWQHREGRPGVGGDSVPQSDVRQQCCVQQRKIAKA
jgi:hypothetical protein